MNKQAIGIISGVTMGVLGVLGGLYVGQTGYLKRDAMSAGNGRVESSGEPEVLYWVAPMDDNYRRDKPGKSPMGMDLVPVYATPQAMTKKEPEILYWVAPMDDNYRRDKPGKSPMGMDLVPVYDTAGDEQDSGPGTITISSAVENNLGVRTAPVQSEPWVTDIKTVGYVHYDEASISHIHSRVTGWIETLYIEAEGDAVVAGQPLFDLYSPELVNAQEEFVLALRQGDKAFIQAAKVRMQALEIPDTLIKAIQRDRKVRQTVPVSAPQSGIVDKLTVRKGFYVKPAMTLVSISNIDNVWVEAALAERDAGMISTDAMAVMTTDSRPGEEWQGAVSYIAPLLDAKQRTLPVRIAIPNPKQRLKPNMIMEVQLKQTHKGTAFVVPKQAVIRTGRADRVVVALGEGRFKSIDVTLGRSNHSQYEVLEGLNAGDEIVTSAQFLLDSESSKTSDFTRMASQDDEVMEPVWVAARINALKPDSRMLNVDHEAIDDWSWPEMTMDFSVVDSLDYGQFKVGMSMHIQIQPTADKRYEITQVHIMDSMMMSDDAKDDDSMSGDVDHSTMQH